MRTAAHVLLAVCVLLQLLQRSHCRYSFCRGVPAYKQPPSGQPPEAVVLRDDQFITVNSKREVHMKAVNWFGFNNGQTAPDGLWAGGTAANTDFATIVYQLRLLGFNGMRLPFIFKDLRGPLKAGWIKQPCQQVSLEDLAKRTTDPQVANPDPASAAPKPAVPLPSVARACNSYLPDTTTLDRYLWAVQWFVANGFYVLVDYHPMGLDDASYRTSAFVSGWQWLWSALSCLPNFETQLKGRVFLDLMNEPDSMGQRWEATNVQGRMVPGVTELYLKTMDALDAITPGVPIYFVEGAGQTGLRGVNWGNGFVTERGLIARNGLSDPNPFFQAVMSKPYRKRVVISPHVYGPSVSLITDTYAGDDFFKVLDASFGYLTRRGYCQGSSNCQRFPVAIGEFGSRFKDPRDLVHLNDFASYLNNQGKGATGGHNAIGNWYYWSYNANSGDTGGLVDDSWRNWMWVKLRWLNDKLGLEPWYESNDAPHHVQRQPQPQPQPMPVRPTK